MTAKALLQGWLSRDRAAGFILSCIGIAGFMETIFGNWGLNLVVQTAAGQNIKLLPQITYLIILFSGIAMVAGKKEKQPAEAQMDLVKGNVLIFFIATGVVYFLAVLKIGLCVTTFIYSAGMFTLLTVNPVKHWKQIIIPSIIVSFFIWLLFDRFVNIVLSDVALF